MSSEMEFKAWDLDYKQMDYSKGQSLEAFFAQNDVGYGNYIFMQYIGLKDKNGKKIYDGDILTAARRNVVVVYNTTDASFELETEGKGLMGMAGVNSVCEIIGNIYENPELI